MVKNVLLAPLSSATIFQRLVCIFLHRLCCYPLHKKSKERKTATRLLHRQQGRGATKFAYRNPSGVPFLPLNWRDVGGGKNRRKRHSFWGLVCMVQTLHWPNRHLILIHKKNFHNHMVIEKKNTLFEVWRLKIKYL